MKAKTISNSKYKNTGVLFELLVRQVTSDTLANKPVSEALNIMKKYFNATTELGKELQLYRAFLETKSLSETKALHFIDLVTEQRKKLDERKLAREKYDLVREIKATYPLKDFLSAKIPNYVVHASIYKTFMNETASASEFSVVNIQDVANAKFRLVEQLTGKVQKKVAITEDSQLVEEFKQQSEDLRLLAYKLVIDRFNEKYANLNEQQKNLLRVYINNVSDSNSLMEYVRREVPVVRESLLAIANKSNDQIVTIKLQEVASNVEKIGHGRSIRDNEITGLLIAYEILKEMSA